jgi:hypothetical protein
LAQKSGTTNQIPDGDFDGATEIILKEDKKLLEMLAKV